MEVSQVSLSRTVCMKAEAASGPVGNRVVDKNMSKIGDQMLLYSYELRGGCFVLLRLMGSGGFRSKWEHQNSVTRR